MKAIVFSELGGPEVLSLADVPKPEVGRLAVEQGELAEEVARAVDIEHDFAAIGAAQHDPDLAEGDHTEGRANVTFEEDDFAAAIAAGTDERSQTLELIGRQSGKQRDFRQGFDAGNHLVAHLRASCSL